MNEYNINVDFTKGRISTNLRKLVQNDYNTTKLNFTFDKEGRVLFKMLYPDGTQYVDEIQNNELVFGKGVLNQEGTYEYEISLYSEDGRLTDYAVKSFEVRSELVDTDEIVEPDDRVPVLDTLINEVNTIKQDVEDGKYNGKDGKNGITPTIGENGNWYIGDIDTGLPSRGEPGKAGSVKFIVANELPSENIEEDAIYMIPEENPDSPTNTKNTYQEYIYVNGAWESLGGTSVEVDLSNYYTKEETDIEMSKLNNGVGIYIWENAIFSFTKNYNLKTAWGEMFTEIINDAYRKGKTGILIHGQPKPPSSDGLGLNYDTSEYLLVSRYNIQNQPKTVTLSTYGVSQGNDNIIFKARVRISGTWTDNVFTLSSAYWDGIKLNLGNYLAKDNTTAYTPTKDYHPATKQYVDNAIASAITTTLEGEY